MQAVVIFLAVLGANLWMLGSPHLARTEAHRAITAHQMVQDGNWLIPRLYGQPYLRKPPLHYWALALSEMVQGANEWAWRLPSALAAAGLAGLVTVMGRRWFGPGAGWVSGLSFLGMATLWMQNRSADIDSLNTAAAAACALGIVEIHYGPTRHRWAWAIFSGAALGATLLLKGPAGLPVIIGAVVGPALLNKDWRRVRWGMLAGVAAVGLALMGAWVVAAMMAVRAAGAQPDLSGLDEIAKRLSFNDPRRIGEAVLLPFTMLAVSMPMSLSLWYATRPNVLGQASEEERLRVRALMGAVLAALAVGVLFLLNVTRYDTITLPLLCPLCGACGAFWMRGWFTMQQSRELRAVLTGMAIVLTVVAVGAGAWVGMGSELGLLVPAAAAGAAGFGIWTVTAWARHRHRLAAWGMVALLMLAVIPIFAWRNMATEEKSGYDAAQELRRTAGAGQTVVAGNALWDKPELFFYSGLPVRFMGMKPIAATAYPAGTVLVLDGEEWKAWENKWRRILILVGKIRVRDTEVMVGRVEVVR